MEEERYNEISNDEAVIKLVGKITLEFDEFKDLQKQIKLKEIIEEGLFEYDVITRCKELITSDLDEKIKKEGLIMNKENLIYVYDIFQAEFIIKEIQADGFYRIGKGAQGDICVSFYNTGKVKQAMYLWSEKAKRLKTN